MDVQGPVRVRFAPNCEAMFMVFITRTILYGWLFARHYGGKFILRIDDTDVDRQVPGSLQSFLDGMRWLGLDWDEGPEVGGSYGPYFQSERLEIYKRYVNHLLATGAAYPCYCTAERLKHLADQQRKEGKAPVYDGRCHNLTKSERARLAAKNPNPTIRFATPGQGVIRCSDLLRGEFSTSVTEIGDFIIVRSDGWPTYHLTVVVDDSLMQITHVIRGADGVTNMARQALVYQALEMPVPKYLHFPLVRTAGFSPSERFYPRGALLYVDELKAAGFISGAVVNYYALLGQSYPSNAEILSRETLIRDFDYRRISRALHVNQALDKLTWFNRRYLQHAATVSQLADACFPFLVQAGLAGAEDDDARRTLESVLPFIRCRLGNAADLVDLLRFVFQTRQQPLMSEMAELAPLPVAVRILDTAAQILTDRIGDASTLATLVAERVGMDYGKVTRLLIVALTGQRNRLPLSEVVTILKGHEAVRRLRLCQAQLLSGAATA